MRARRNPDCVVHYEPTRVALRLRELGLTTAQLTRPLGRGLAASRLSHDYHPTSYPGLVMWGESVRWLRDGLVQTGEWRCDDTYNLPTAVRLDGSMAIAVVRGDAGTGDPDAAPSTQYARGVSTEARVNVNRVLPFDHLPPEMFSDGGQRSRVRTYLLLHHLKGDRLHAELSLPVRITRGYVEEFSERIILGVIDPDGGSRLLLSDDSPVRPVVQVRRRA